MRLQKTIAIILMIAMLPIASVSAEMSFGQLNEMIATLQGTVSKYADTIRNLQDENAKLQKRIDELSKQINSASTPAVPSKPDPVPANTSTKTGSTAPSQSSAPTKISTVDKYNKLIDKINSISASIFEENDLPTDSSIGLFEFVEPSSFFISIDDKKNPEGETAYKKKILYSYDNDLNLKVTGVFVLDYATGYYTTKFGSNPFAKATRIKIKNPLYNGKLALIPTATSSSSSSTTTSKPTTTSTTTATTTSTPASTSGNVTADAVKTAYNKNKILDALKLSGEYIKTDPNNIEIAKIRYRSYYILGKFAESLTEIQKIESIQGGSNMEKVVACDAKTIAKLAKNAELNKRYGELCTAKSK